MSEPDLPERIQQVVESHVLVPDVKVKELAKIIAAERARADALQAKYDEMLAAASHAFDSRNEHFARADALEAALREFHNNHEQWRMSDLYAFADRVGALLGAKT